MKTIETIKAAAALGIVLVSTSFLAEAQPAFGRGGARPGGPGGPGGAGRPDPSVIAAHLAERYSTLAGFDVNRDGQLDPSEAAVVAAKIVDGSLEATPPGGPRRGGGGGGEGRPEPTAEQVVSHIAESYAKLAAFDTNRDAQLDETEKAGVGQAIADGSLRLGPEGGMLGRPGGPGHRGGPGVGAPQAKEHRAARYAELVAFDTDRNGQLDPAEQVAVVAALESGTLQSPGRPHGPGENRPEIPAEAMVERISGMYARLAAADGNRDGQLDATEMETVGKRQDGAGGSDRPGKGKKAQGLRNRGGHRPEL